MITLKQFLETQNFGYRQNFKYKIVSALELFSKAHENERIDSFTIRNIKDGKIYSNIDNIEKELYDSPVYRVEPDYDYANACLYLRIVIM